MQIYANANYVLHDGEYKRVFIIAAIMKPTHVSVEVSHDGPDGWDAEVAAAAEVSPHGPRPEVVTTGVSVRVYLQPESNTSHPYLQPESNARGL